MKSKRNSVPAMRLLYGMIAGLLLGISALAIYIIQDHFREPEPVDTGHFNVEGEAQFDGVIRIEPPIVVPNFALTNQDGYQTSLRDLNGRHALLTFGFTNCPDICPLTLSDFQQISELLGDQADQVEFVFISVDGSRDSPAVLREYLRFRELAGITALTGSEEKLREIGAPFGLSFEISGDTSTGAYSVNHTVGSFLIDSKGRWIMRFQFGVPADQIAAELVKLL